MRATRRPATGFWYRGRTPQGREQSGKGATDPRRCQFFQWQRWLPGQADILHERLGKAQLHVSHEQQPSPAVCCRRGAQFGDGPLQWLLEETEEMLDGKASNIHVPHHLQVRGKGTRPPEPQRHGCFRQAWQVAHFQANEGSGHDGARLTRPPFGVILGNRMQSAPRLDEHLPIVRLRLCPNGGGCGPRGRIHTDTFGTMSARTSRLGGVCGIRGRIKATPGSQTHEQTDPLIRECHAQWDRIVARITGHDGGSACPSMCC